MTDDFRIGMIVPSSNVTMETEIPAMLAAAFPTVATGLLVGLAVGRATNR